MKLVNPTPEQVRRAFEESGVSCSADKAAALLYAAQQWTEGTLRDYGPERPDIRPSCTEARHVFWTRAGDLSLTVRGGIVDYYNPGKRD